MICRICFDKLTQREEYNLANMEKYTIMVCEDCRWERPFKTRPLQKKDEPMLRKLYYEGDSKKERLVW
jgi:hypothetical protein